MNIASPLSVLERIKPDQVALGAGQILTAGRTAATQRGDESRSAIGAVRAADTSNSARPGFATTLGRGELPPHFHADTATAAPEARTTGQDLFEQQTQTAARLDAPLPSPAADALPPGLKESMAETVVAAGLDGLDALARGPVARLATGLAQATYAALRPLA